MTHSIHLGQALESLYRKYHIDYLPTDPLEVARQYSDPEDQEIAAFIAALFALGRADLIRKTVRDILGRMGASPYRFVLEFDPRQHSALFQDFSYRFYKGRDVSLLIWWLKQMIDKTGSIRSFFLKGYESGDAHIGPSLSRFIRSIMALETRPFYSSLPAPGRGARHFLNDPVGGSGCKRWNLFLRWMVRRDGLDLGLWTEISTAQLVIPLDTYIARIGQRVGFTKRATPNWKMALEITQNLKRFDARDPVKYDFALCRVGMIHHCPVQDGECNCTYCPLYPFCT